MQTENCEFGQHPESEICLTESEAQAVKLEEAVASLQEASEQAAIAAEELAATSKEASSLVDPIAALSDAAMVHEYVYLAAVFVMAIFVGYYVVWSVTPALHTPLMSVTNAISSVVIVGALVAVGAEVTDNAAGFWAKALGFLGVAFASVNIFGAFAVTQRMLAMYKKKDA